MVLLHLKNSEQDQFLYELPAATPVKDVIHQLVQVYNLRHRIMRLKLEGGELAKYGPAKHPDKQGIDTYAEEPVEQSPHYTMDPTGRRTGHACDPEVAKTLLQTLDDAEVAASKAQVASRLPLTARALLDAVDLIRGGVMICYPMGLPEWDFVRQCLEGTEDLTGTSFGGEDLEAGSATLWFAGKQLLPEKHLTDYLGRNDRTRAVVKLQSKGAGPPSREPVVDAETQKAMMAFYYKKQEEQKALAQDDGDCYTNSSWASGTSLKQYFAGVGDIRIR